MKLDFSYFFATVIGVAVGAGIVLAVGFASGQLPLDSSTPKICPEQIQLPTVSYQP